METGGGPAIINYGVIGGGVQQQAGGALSDRVAQRPRLAVVYRDALLVVANYGPRLFHVHLKSPPIGEIFVKWQEIPALADGSVHTADFTLLSTDGKTVLACGLEVAVLDSEHSAVPIGIICQDQDRGFWEGSGALLYDRTTRQWTSAGFEEMRPVSTQHC